MADARLFRRITADEARKAIDTWHYTGKFGSAEELFGVEEDGEVIAAAIFIPARQDPLKMVELLATVKKPDKKLYMSQLLKYCRNQLKDKYHLMITFYETTRSKGWQSQGDNWKYSGVVNGKEIIQKAIGNMYLYWIALTPEGEELAKSKGLVALPYPK